MIVLAFDIASKVGWAAGPLPSPSFGHFEVDYGSGAEVGRALYEFAWRLDNLIRAWEPTHLAYEKPITERAHGIKFSEFIWGATGYLNLLSFQRKLPIFACSIGAVRKHFIGTGANNKEAKGQVFHRCQVLGWKPKTMDESDAGAVWDYAHGVLKSRRWTE